MVRRALQRKVRDGLSDGVIFEQRPEGKEGAMPTTAGRVFLTEGTACAKVLSRKQ